MEWKAVSFDTAARKRIEEASIFEKRLRIEGLLNLKQQVGPFSLRQITPRDILHLEYAENRIAIGEDPKLDDYVHLVWSLSKKKRFFKVGQIRKITNIIKSSESIKREIVSFYIASFNDFPTVGSNTKVDNTTKSSVYICSIIDSIASSYGWNLNDILDTSMSTLLQLMQRSLKRNLGDKYAIRNAITQNAKSEELKRINSNG